MGLMRWVAPCGLSALLLVIVAGCASEQTQAPVRHRSTAVRDQFLQAMPCPATGGRGRVPCPGWEIDHRTPLCAGGDDALHNLQWLTVAEHRAKTREDRRACAKLRRQQAAERLRPD